MKYVYLSIASFCTFTTLFNFDGTVLQAINGMCAVLNFGMFEQEIRK